MRWGSRGVFGKGRDGRVRWWAVVVLGPYLGLVWVVWRVQRWVSRERCADEIVPGVWVGRRPVCGEVPEGVGMVVDVTCEFAASAAVRRGREYVCVPMLDGVACDEGCLAEVVERVARYSGGVYIHCAQGHGRSAMLAAAVLVAKGYAKDVDEAVRMLVGRRAGIRLSAGQRGVVARVVKAEE